MDNRKILERGKEKPKNRYKNWRYIFYVAAGAIKSEDMEAAASLEMIGTKKSAAVEAKKGL